MTKFTWILYLVASALVFASWMGLVSPEVGWIGWGVATAVALQSWLRKPCGSTCGWTRPVETPPAATTFTPEEVEAARREVHGEEPEASAAPPEADIEEPVAANVGSDVEESDPTAEHAEAGVEDAEPTVAQPEAHEEAPAAGGPEGRGEPDVVG